MYWPHSISQLTCFFVCQLTNALSIVNTIIIVNWQDGYHLSCRRLTTHWPHSISPLPCVFFCQLKTALSIDNTAIINRVVIDTLAVDNNVILFNWHTYQLRKRTLLSTDNIFLIMRVVSWQRHALTWFCTTSTLSIDMVFQYRSQLTSFQSRTYFWIGGSSVDNNVLLVNWHIYQLKKRTLLSTDNIVIPLTIDTFVNQQHLSQ